MSSVNLLQFSIRIVSIALSTTLILVAMLSDAEVAWCGNGTTEGPVTINSAELFNDVFSDVIYWPLVVSVALGVVRIGNHALLCVSSRFVNFITIVDIAQGIVKSSCTIIPIIVVVDCVQKSTVCWFSYGASPFVGLLVASCGISTAMSIFDVVTLVIRDAHPYEKVAITQQLDQDQGQMASNDGSVPMVRLEIDNDSVEVDDGDGDGDGDCDDNTNESVL